MDDRRFDAIARGLARHTGRRPLLRALAGGLAGLVAGLVGGAVGAKPNPRPCRADGRNCAKDDQCCSRYCRGRRGRRTCAACASGIVCGDTCCPENAVNGCTVVQGPNGPVVGCLCPCETEYDRAANACVPVATCETDAGCCSGSCCDGACCPEGERCCGGTCRRPEDCVCPPGTGCSGTVSCSRCGVTYSTAGTCCSYPRVGFCCSDSSANAGDGIALCCTPGVDCPTCPDGSVVVQAGPADAACCVDGTCGGGLAACCRGAEPGGDGNGGAPCCVVDGLPCPDDGDAPGCCGTCDGGVCRCLPAGTACDPEAASCCAGFCDPIDRICARF